MGKLLRVKYGYNPNSSSIGTHISVYVYGAACVALVVNTLAAAVAAARRRNTDADEQRHECETSRNAGND